MGIKRKHYFFFSVYILLAAFMAITPAKADVNDFTITNYDITYTLGRNDEKRSTLTTTEKITAHFPNVNQNRGIERAIPASYDGHPTNLEIVSVTDGSGNGQSYQTYESNGNTVVRIGDEDVYVQGTKTYVITYTQQDVTKAFANTKNDEFYWDTNGTDWRVPIQRLNVTLQLDDSLARALSGNTACYAGAAGSSAPCDITRNGNQFNVTRESLLPGDNVTLAVGFTPNTFAEYEQSLAEKVFAYWLVLQLLLAICALGDLVWLAARYHRASNRKDEVGTIVPEYLPPKNVSVEVAAHILGLQTSFSAQIIDLAVRHYIKIYETKPKRLLLSAEYEIEIIRDVGELRAEEQELLSDLYGHVPTIGERFALKDLKKSTSLVHMRMYDNTRKRTDLIRGEYQLRAKMPERSAWFGRVSLRVLIAAIVLLSPALLVVAIVAFIMSRALWPLTDTGLALKRYLEGLKMYISVAEVDRIKMLQSPEGAAKTNVTGEPDTTQLVTLYERVLPYAILFKQEKEWNKQLGSYYESTRTQPDWYAGAHGAVFSANAFSSSPSSFSSSFASASSSTSGGSTGSGSSGGGGGGGGGGW